MSSYIAFALFMLLVFYSNNGYGPRSCYAAERSSDRICVVEITLNLQWACSCETVSKFGTFVVLLFLTQSRAMASDDKLPSIDKLNDSNWPVWKLQNVLFVPKLNNNFFSVSAATAQGNSLVFERSCCWVYDRKKELVAKGESKSKMFILRADTQVSVEKQAINAALKCFILKKKQKIFFLHNLM